MSSNSNGYVHMADELAAIVGSSTGLSLAESGWTNGHPARTFEVGDVVYAHVRGALRRGKVAKTSTSARAKNITVEVTTEGAINEARRYGWPEPCLTAKIVPAVDVYVEREAERFEAAVVDNGPAAADGEAATIVKTAPEVAADETPAATINREAWLTTAVDTLRPMFAELALVELPDTIVVSVGWPGGKSVHKVIGQCWATSTADGVSSVFISPALVDPIDVLGVLVHELIHAWDDCKSGHKGAFVKVAGKLGLEGKMTATTVGDALRERLQLVADTLGVYPHKKVTPGVKIKAQTTRMLKVQCESDEYTVRMTRKWLDELGAPTCPCGSLMVEVDA